MEKKNKKRKLTEHSKNYIAEYNRNTYKLYGIKIKKNDIDIIEKLDSVENKAIYITDLIRKDLKKEQ